MKKRKGLLITLLAMSMLFCAVPAQAKTKHVVTKEVSYYKEGSKWQKAYTIINTYSKKGLLLKTKGSDGVTVTYKYKKGLLVEQDENEGNKVIFSYKNGLLKTEKYVNSKGKTETTTTYTYNAKKQMTKETTVDSSKEKTVYKYTYNAKGQLVKKVDPDDTTTYKYYTSGKAKGMLKEETTENDDYTITYTYKFNKNGTVKAMIFGSGSDMTKEVYTYKTIK